VKRTREWWGRLKFGLRKELVSLEWDAKHRRFSDRQCGHCGAATAHGELCVDCYSALIELRAIGNGDPI